MAGRRGRPNTDLLARVGRIIALLQAHPNGLTTEELRERVGYGNVSRASQLRTLNRDLAYLADEGWRIDTVPDGHNPARRILRTVDSRFATLFTPGQRAQLARAAACAGPQVATALATDLGTAPGEPPFLLAPSDGYARMAVCQAAAADRCQLCFYYAGRRRVTSPVEVVLGRNWYLRALDHTGPDDATGTYKTFMIERMRRLAKGPPGSARPVDAARAGAAVIDPMALRRHEPVEVGLLTDADNLADVLGALGRHGYTLVEIEPPGTFQVNVSITNLGALPGRLFELGERVRLLGPPSVRDQIAAALAPRSRT